MGGVLAHEAGFAVPAGWGDAAEWLVGPIDRLDVTANLAGIRVQFLHKRGWLPEGGIYIARGVFRSLPGLTLADPPGPLGVRFKRANAGAAGTVDFEAWGL